jgi:hypothetical protein
MGQTVYRLTWEGTDTSLNAIVSQAAAFRADATANPTLAPLKLYVTLDVSTQDIGTGVTFTTEALARAYGVTSGSHCASALAPYSDVIIGISCGNEMTRKDSIMPATNVMGTNPSDFTTAKWNIFRGVQAGTFAGIKSVTTAIPVFSNAWTFAEIAAPQMLWDGSNPDGTTGYEQVRYDGYDVHSYHAWNNPFIAPDDSHSGWVPFFNYIEQYAVRFGGRPIVISEYNADADSQTDAAMAAWVLKVNTDFYNARFDYNIASIIYYAMFNADFNWGCVDTSNNAISTRGQTLANFIATNPDADNGTITQQAFAVIAKYPGAVRLYLPEWAWQDSSGTIFPTNGTGMQFLPELMLGGSANNANQATSPATYSTTGPSLTFAGSPYLITSAFYGVTDDFAVVVGAAPSGTAPAIASAKAAVALSSTNATSKYGRLGSVMFSASGVTAEWYGDTGSDFQATWAYPGGTYTTPRVCTSRKVGTTGSLRINGAQQATVDLTSFSGAFVPTAGWIGAQFANDTSGFSGSLYGVIGIKGKISDADLLVLEQWMNSMTPTGVTIGSVPSSSGTAPVVNTSPTLTASTNGTSVPASGTNLIEADTTSSDATRIFANGVDFALPITTRAAAADTLNYTIYDAEDNVAASGSFAVPATPRTTTLKINSTKSGYFRIKCALATAGGAIATVGSQPAGFCTFGVKAAITSVLPAPTYAHQDQHRFGIQGFNDNGPVLRALGVTQTLDDRDWSTMEPTSDGQFVASAANGDQFYYTNTDIMRLVRGDGVPDRYLATANAGQRDSWAPSSLTNFQAYWAKVGTETERLRGTYYPTQAKNYYQPTWEPDVTWLDTDVNFIAMQTAFYNGVHSTDPNAIVMGPTDSFITATNNHLQRLAAISSVYWAHVDGISTHGYWDAGTFPSHRPEQRGASTDAPTALNGMAQAYNTLRTTMNAVRPGMKLYQTEMGVGYEFAYNYGNAGINANYLYAHGATVAVGATISIGEGVDVHYPFFGGDYTQESNGSAGYGTFFTLSPVLDPGYPIPNISPKPAAMALHTAISVLDGTTTLGRDLQFTPVDNGIHAYWHQRIGGGKCILEAHTFKDAQWQLGAFSNTYTRNATFNVDASGTSGTVPVIDWMGNISLMPYTNGQLTLALKQHPQYVVVSNVTVAKANSTVPVGYVAAN